jgi:hypothetical protein
MHEVTGYVLVVILTNILCIFSISGNNLGEPVTLLMLTYCVIEMIEEWFLLQLRDLL